MKQSTVQRAGGFSVVELLVTIGVISLLLGLTLPAVQGIRARAMRVACANNLRQIGIASHHYHDLRGSLPPAYVQARIGKGASLSWRVLLLPYIEQEPLWLATVDAYRSDWYSWEDPPHVGLSRVVETYVCQADARLLDRIADEQGYTAAYGSYQGVAGGTRADGAMRPQHGVRFGEITDGTSQTLFIGERPAAGRRFAGAWYDPALPDPAWWRDDYSFGRLPYMSVVGPTSSGRCAGPFWFGPGRLENPCDSNHFWSLHPGGANFLFADGAVHFLDYSVRDIMVQLGTRAGGEVVVQDY